MSPAADTLTDRRPPHTATAYRRQARRLRCRFRGDTSALHLSLRALAARRDAVRASDPLRFEFRRPEADAPRRPSVARVTAIRAGFEPRFTPPPPTSPPTASARPLTDSSVFAASNDAIERFSALVEATVEQGVLRHSRRESLFNQADALGIGRFEANLIIAAVQNRGPRANAAVRSAPAPSGAAVAVAAVVLVQSIVAVAAWCFWHA